MADNWQPIEAPPWAKQAGPAEPQWQPIEAPPWAKKEEERGGISEAVRPITTYLPTQKEMAHESVEQVKRGIEQLKEPTGGDLKKSAEAAFYGVGNVGLGALGFAFSPITAAYRTVVEKPVAETTGSPLAGQLAGFTAQLATPGIGFTRMPGAKPVPSVPTSTLAERRAGKAIERQASDIGKVKEKLETEPAEIVPGSKQTTFEMTDDPGLGAAERKAKLRSPTPYVERAEERAGARLKALEGQQETGNVADTVEHVRQSRARGEWSIQQDVALADQRAREAAELPGGQYDPATYGNVLRQELRNAEAATRAEETARWQQVDPGGRLRANPQPLQELERSIYGVMPEGGAAEASLTAAEQKVAGVIQNYPSVVPFQELRDLRHLINTELREELITSGRSPAYARLSRLRQGIADMEEGAFTEMGVRDPEAAQRLRTASTATRERAEQFGRGPVGDVLRREGSQGPFKVETAQVNDKLLPTGNKGYDVASSYLRAAPDSLEAYTDALTGKMRREVLRPDGSVDPRKLEGFLRRHDGVLRAVSERDGGAYAQSLRDIGQAQERLATTLERQRANTEAFEGSELGKLVGAADNDHAINIVGNIFGRADRVDRARQLAEAASGSPAAQAGLRRAVQQYVRKTFVGNAEAAGGTQMIPPNAFMKFMKENEAALRQIMLPEQVDAWKAIATEMGRTSRIAQTKTLPGSDTVQNALSVGGSWPWVVADMAIGQLTTGMPLPLGHAAKPILKGLLSHVKKNGITSTNRLIDEAMLNPEVARELLKAKGRPLGASVRMEQRTTPLLRTGTIRAATPDDEQQKRAPRQAGGGVPAIGGTGGRSPGAREIARAGAARGGTGQALQDGGAEGDEQAREIVLSLADGGEVQQPSPAPRERWAAALQGTPTGAGFGGGSAQQRKPQALKTPTREEIRRTLQSFGITGEEAGGFSERQLGERPVDSRAYGGGVDDPSGERSPMHYDPGDDTTFDARFGKWDKTATGKSLPRDDEDVDSTILVPGQKMIHQGGYEGERGQAGYYMTHGMADGGSLGRWEQLPSSRNIEDRRDEEPLSAGQLVAGNQAFMGKYPSPYTRAPRRAVTAEAHADGGEVGGDNPLRITVRPQLPDALIDQTKSYLSDQINGVDREHEKQDPLEAMIEEGGGRRKANPSDGASDEGINPFEAAAARTRRRAPVREPDPASLAASQGRVGWGDVARDKLEKGIKTVTAPGRAYKEGMTDDEMIEAAQGMAGLMGGARFPGVAAGVSEGSLGIFGGKGSKTADLDMMHRAMEMRAKGVRPESVWNQTGWFRGPEGLWRYEIPDYDMRLKPTETTRPLTQVISSGEEGMSRPSLSKSGELHDITEHPEFARAYPKLMHMPAEMQIGVRPGGGYMPPDWLMRRPDDVGHVRVEAPLSKEVFAADLAEAPSEITPRRILLHEMQHAVQAAEDFAPGGNPMALPYSQQQIAAMTKKRAEAEGLPWAAINVGQRQTMYNMMRQHLYERLAGEVEARNVERRRDITGYRPPPWKTEDVRRPAQFVFSDPALAYGFKPQKGQKPFKLPMPYADGGEVDEAAIDEPAEAQAARETAAARTGHRGRQEGATTSFLDSALPVWMRANAEKARHYPEAAKALGNLVATIPERIWGAGRQAAFLPQERLEEEFDPSGPGDLVQLGLGARMPVKAAPGEVVLGAGRTRPPTPPRSHNLPPGEEPLPLERRTSSLSLRDMPLDKAIEQAKTEQHLIPSNPKVKSGYVGAPNWVRTPEDLAKLRADFDAQVERGLLGAKWYEEAQGGIKEMAPDDPRRQHQASQELALTSAQSTPDTNLGFMLQGHNAIAAGKPLSVVRTGAQAKTMREGHAAGKIHLGRKTGIYARHMDPTMEDPATGTNDIWHARALGYGDNVSSLSASQHAFMDAETLLAVARANEKKLGGRDNWTAGEIQAAPWVAGKAQGLQEQFGWTPERSLAEAIKTYPQFFNKYTAFGTHEATPGIGTRHLPGIASGTEAERAEFAANPASTWRDPNTGEDILYRAAGMYTRPTLKATGIFDRPATATDPGGLEVNPAEVARPMVSFKGKSGSRELGTADRALMTGVEAARAFVDAQNAGAFSVPIWNQKGIDSRSVYIPRPGGVPPGPMPLGDVKQLLAIGGRRGLPAAIDYGQGTAMTSFGGEGAATGKEIAAGLRPKGALGQELRTALPGTEPGRVKLDTGYIDYQTLDADRPRKKRPGWDRPEGSGEVVRELQKRLSSREAPDLIANLDADPSIRMAVADRIHRDIQLAEKAGHPIREDLMRARQIIVEDGFAGLFEALKRGVALPAAAVVPALELLRQLQGQEQSSGG